MSYIVYMVNSDVHTILRHLVTTNQWGGHLGERQEAFDALGRLEIEGNTADETDTPDTNVTKVTPATVAGTKNNARK